MKYINIFKLICLFAFSTFQYGHAQHLVSAELLISYTKADIDAILESEGIPPGVLDTEFDVDVYKVLYNSTSFDGSNVVASGIMVVPQLSCELPIFNWNHGTISKRSQAPSASNGGLDIIVCSTMASNGYISLAPDYFGLGEDESMLHPYQHADTEANAVIDFVRATREFCQNEGIALNDQIFLSGYSQGGHVAMASHRKMQMEFPDEFTVTASSPMSGAYDMSGVMVDVMLSDASYSDPAYLPFLVFSWAQIYDSFEAMEDVIKPEYFDILTEMFDGNSSMGEINQIMPVVPKDIFIDEVLEAFTNDPDHYLRIALAENNSYTDWVPEAPMNMYYCTADETVSFQNTVVANQHFLDNGCTNCQTIDVDPEANHQDCAQTAVILTKFFFDGFQELCPTDVKVTDASTFQEIRIFPNPASEQISLRYDLLQGTTVQYQLFDAFGKMLFKEQEFQQSGPHHKAWNVANLTPGLYFLSINNQIQKINITR